MLEMKEKSRNYVVVSTNVVVVDERTMIRQLQLMLPTDQISVRLCTLVINELTMDIQVP